MKVDEINAALASIRATTEPVVKAQKLASLCSAVFRERAVELVVVGGSAIEFYTDGGYVSGDLDFCFLPPTTTLPLRQRQEIMAQLDARGGPRSWQVAGLFVDLLGPVETVSRQPVRQLAGPYGAINLVGPEELLVERVLVAVYPKPDPEARAVARQLAGVALSGGIDFDWAEVEQLATRPEYNVNGECQALVREVADELELKDPFDPA